MWRRLIALVHPDRAGGDHDLFIWVRALYEHVAGDHDEDARSYAERRSPPPRHGSAGDRLDFSAAYDVAGGFDQLTRRAVGMAAEVAEPYAGLLLSLADCHEVHEIDIALSRQQQQGASYRSLAAIAYAAGMSKAERIGWYRVAEAVPLSQRHAGHILARLKKEAA